MQRGRRPGLADGRRRPARAPTASALLLAQAERDGLDFCGPAGAWPSRTPAAAGASRSGSPAASEVVHQLADVEAAAHGRPDQGHRDPVQRGAGHPRPGGADRPTARAEYFIWGDDHEYRLAGREAPGRGSRPSSALRCSHPSVGDLGTPMAWGRATYNHTPSDLKHYCMARNDTCYNLRAYRGWPCASGCSWRKTLWFYLLTKPQPARIPLSCPGRGGRPSAGTSRGHERYLR